MFVKISNDTHEPAKAGVEKSRKAVRERGYAHEIHASCIGRFEMTVFCNRSERFYSCETRSWDTRDRWDEWDNTRTTSPYVKTFQPIEPRLTRSVSFVPFVALVSSPPAPPLTGYGIFSKNVKKTLDLKEIHAILS